MFKLALAAPFSKPATRDMNATTAGLVMGRIALTVQTSPNDKHRKQRHYPKGYNFQNRVHAQEMGIYWLDFKRLKNLEGVSA